MDCKGDRKSSRLVKDIVLMAITMTVALFLGFISVWLLLFWRSFMLPLLSVRLTSRPRRIPLVGDMLTVKHFELSVQEFADELKRKFCPVMALWAGSEPVLIISGPEIFKCCTHLPSKRINLTFGNRPLTFRRSLRHRFRRKAVRNEILSKKGATEYRPIRDQELSLVAESKKKEHGIGVFKGVLTVEENYMELEDVMLQRFQMGVGNLREFTPLTSRLALGKKNSEIYEPQVEATKHPVMDILLGLHNEEIFVISTNVDDLQFCGFLIL
ncbi:unnamed protein product [Calypogeia fissa]